MAVIGKKIIDLLQYRVQKETESSRLYLAMSHYFNLSGYVGAAKLWDAYAKEEAIHADKVYDYLLDLNIKPIIPALEVPKFEEGFIEIIDQSFKHELEITNQCNDLAKACSSEGDYMTLELALWFVNEQREEINKTMKWVDMVENQGGDNISYESIMLIDNKMGE